MTKLTVSSIQNVVNKNIVSYPIIDDCLKVALNKLMNDSQDVLSLLEIPIIRRLYTNTDGIKYFEGILEEVGNYTDITKPLRNLSCDFKNKYHSTWTEIWTAKQLHDNKKATKISFSAKNKPYDLEYSLEDGITRYVEVKSFDSIDPAMSYLVNVFEALSITDPRFRKHFITSCLYPEYIKNLKSLQEDLKSAINELKKRVMESKNIDDFKLKDEQINGFIFNFRVTKTTSDHCVIFHSGNVKTNNPASNFLELYSVYSRIINKFAEGYHQLIMSRNGNKQLVKQDLLMMYLNIGGSARIFPESIEKTTNDLAKALSLRDLVNLEFEF